MTDLSPHLVSCVGTTTDLDLLPHFLRHYRGLGVAPQRMHLIVHAPDPSAPEVAAARRILEDAGVEPAEIWTEPYTSGAMWDRRRAVQRARCAPDDWVLSADIDEHHEYPAPLNDCLARLDAMGVTCVQGPFIDRMAEGGLLPPARAGENLETQFPLAGEVMWALGGAGAHHDRYGTVKLMAIKGHVVPSRGGHHPLGGQDGVRHLYAMPLGDFPGIARPAMRFSLPFRVHHFHWRESLLESLRRRLATPGVSSAGAEYGAKVLDHIETHGGIDLSRVALMIGRHPPSGAWLRRVARLRSEARARLFHKRLRAVVSALRRGNV